MLKQDFNHDWFFRRGLDNPMTSAFVGGTAELIPVTLPYDAMLGSERGSENTEESGIGFFTPENVEYERRLELKEKDVGNIVYLECEGVYSNAVLEINGAVASRHRFGFTGFVTKISDYLKVGENKIKITVLNGVKPNGRYYTGTGIYRDISLMIGNNLHVVPDGIRLTTVEADPELAVIEVAARIRHDGTGHRKAQWNFRMEAENGETAVASHTVFNIFSNEEIVVRQRLYLKQPDLWGTETPSLYQWECFISEEGVIIDKNRGSFGVRKLSLDPVHGLRLNGKNIKLKGGCIHSDNGFIGAVSLPDAERRRIRMLKEAGYNAVRTAHNPVSHAFLDACDEYGMLVMEEYADAWTHSKPAFDYSIWMPDCWEQDIEDMIRVAYNHPCVIMYSIGNEIMDVGSDLSACWGRRFAEKIRALDQDRFITNGLNVMMANLDKMDSIAADMGIDLKSGEINNMMAQVGQLMGALVTHPISLRAMEESCQMLDVTGYNYAAHMYEMEHEKWPDRIFVGTETNPPELDKNWELVEKHAYVLGDFAWTCWDYLGEPGIGRIEEKKEGFNVYSSYPWLAAYCGDFDMTGFRRPVSFWREIIWGGRDHRPYIAVQRPENFGKDMYFSQWSWTDSIHSWTWPGQEGKPVTVEVYSDAEEVELFLDEVSLGIRKPDIRSHRSYFRWTMNYVPGTLKAVARIGGTDVGQQTLSTVRKSRLTAHADKQILEHGSRALSFIEIEYCDEDGTLDYSVSHQISIKARGEIEILGSGTADPRTEESYMSGTHRIYEGRALAVIRAGEMCGNGTVTICDETGDEIELDFTVK